MLTFLRGSLPARRSPSLQREMKSDMTAEAFVEQHGPALLASAAIGLVEGVELLLASAAAQEIAGQVRVRVRVRVRVITV